MKFHFWAAITAAVACMPAVHSQQPDAHAAAYADSASRRVLTLDECLRIAMSESPTVKVADLDIKRMDYSRKEVLGSILPSVSFGGTYSRMLAKQVAYMNLDGFGSMSGGSDNGEENETGKEKASAKRDEGFKMGLDNSFQVGFSASVPLLAPQLWQSLKLSDSQIAQSVEQARASRLDLVNQVKSAYYAYLLAKDSRRVVQESYDMARFTHNLYVGRHSVGDASEYDVLRSSVAMKNIEPEITQADIAISRARLQLLILMGIAPGEGDSLDFAGELKDYEKTMYGDVMAMGTDWRNNSTLRLNELQTKTLEQSVKVSKMAWFPTLALSANYNWTSSSNGSPFKNFRWNPYSIVGLTLNIPIFEGGQRYSRIRQAQVQVEMARMQRQDLENSISMQVDLANDNIKLNVKQIASCAESVGQAERAHTIMQQSFDIGAASYLDLRDSELALTRSRLAYYQAIYNYLIASSELELLLGNAVLPE